MYSIRLFHRDIYTMCHQLLDPPRVYPLAVTRVHEKGRNERPEYPVHLFCCLSVDVLAVYRELPLNEKFI